jgi:hypothetical protein
LLFTYVEKNGIGSWNGASAFVPGKSAKQVNDPSSSLTLKGIGTLRLTRIV